MLKLKLGTVYKHSSMTGSAWTYYIFMDEKHMIYYDKDFTQNEKTERLNWNLVYPELYKEYHPNRDEQKLVLLGVFK